MSKNNVKMFNFDFRVLIDEVARDLRSVMLKVSDMIKEKEKEKEYVVHFRYYTWMFNPKRMAHYFKKNELKEPTLAPPTKK
jgi:hypothetical protein